MSIELQDIPFSGDEDINYDDDDPDNSSEHNNTNLGLNSLVLTTRQQVIDFCLSKVPAYCRSRRNLVSLKNVAKGVFSSDCLPGHGTEEVLLYQHEVYCEFLAQRLEHMIKKLAAKCRLNKSANPHLCVTLTASTLCNALNTFISFISYTYDRERFCWDTFFDDCEIQIWIKRLENFRAHCNDEYVFSSEEDAVKCAVTVINNRGAKFVTECRTMLMLFDIVPANRNDLRQNLGIKTPKINLMTKKPHSFPLCVYDLDKCLDKLLHDNYNPYLLLDQMRSIGAYFTPEENVFYLSIADLARILKLKLAAKTGVRLSSIGGYKNPEASLKVNDLSIIMTGPLCFKIYVRIKIFKTRESAATYVIYSDGTTFDFTALMVVYLANRDLFVRPLSDCINQNDFTLKITDEYLFPVHDCMLRMDPHIAPDSRSGRAVEWYQRTMNVPSSHVNASSTRKGYFITSFCNFIQTAPHSSLSKLFNMVCSRSGWNSKLCWLYGKSPLLDATLLRNIYIHRVKEAMDAGLPKPNAIDFVPTVTTAALPQQELSRDDAFDEYYRKELASREQKKEQYLKYIKYLKSLKVTNFNNITAQTLKDMQRFVTKCGTAKHKNIVMQFCIRQWKVKNAVLDNAKVIYDKKTNDFRQLDIQAIAADSVTSICHVFDKSKADYNPSHLWCTKCNVYIDKELELRSNFQIVLPNGDVKWRYANIHRKPNTRERCKDNVFDRRYVKLIFNVPNDNKLSCGCLRGKCLKYDSEINSLFNFASLSASARVCFTKEECDDKQRFRECIRQMFFSRVHEKLEHVPTCAYEMFDIASKAYFPEIDEDDWTFVSSDYYFDYLRR